MVFVLQNYRQRESKDTVFDVRGQQFNISDIEQYWKRKNTDTAALARTATAPDGVSYRTPARVLDTNVLLVESRDVVILEAGLDTAEEQITFLPLAQTSERPTPGFISSTSLRKFAIDSHDARQWLGGPRVVDFINWPTFYSQLDHQQRANGMSSIDWYRIRTLEPFLDNQIVIVKTRDFCQNDVATERQGLSWAPHQGQVDEVANKMIHTLAVMKAGLSDETIELAHLDMATQMSKLTTAASPYLMAMLLKIVVTNYSPHSRSDPILDFRQRYFLENVVTSITCHFATTHPIAVMLKAMVRSYENPGKLATILLSASRQILQNGKGGDDDLESMVLVRSSCDIAIATGDKSAALRYAQEFRRLVTSKSKTSMPDREIWLLLVSQRLLALALMNVESYTDAENLVQDGPLKC
jgi:hypothetical protein